MNWNNYWRELQRRNVIKAGLAYLVTAWLITQVLSIVLPAFGAHPSVLKWALIALGIGFPLWLIFAWIYEFTPEGIKKTDEVEPTESISRQTGNRLNKMIITTLALVIIVLLIDRFMGDSAKVMDFGDKSIAVLAFADMSPDKDHEYFSDGVSEELLNRLAKFQDLKVMSRTSSFSYKGKNATAKKIGEELKVSYILEGSIRKAGGTVRVTAKLIKTDDGTQEWSKTFDRNLDSIFRIQDEIASAVTRELEISLLGKSEVSETNSSKAYNLYLQAKHLSRQTTKQALIEAESKIKESIAIDSNYAPSWGLLAKIYDTGTYNFSIRNNEEGIALGMNAINRSLQIDPESSQSYATLSSLKELNWNFEESAAAMEKALEISPNDAVILGTAALRTFGNLEKTVELLQKAINLDPLIYGNYFNLGHTYLRLNRLDEAEQAFDTFELYYPNWQILHYMKARIHLAQGQLDEALEEIKKEKHEFFSLYGQNFVYYAMGDTEKADALFEEYLEKFGSTDYANTADLYAFRGNYDKSFEYLRKALETKDPVLIEALTYTSFKPMYADPRWKQLINDIDLPEDHGYKLN